MPLFTGKSLPECPPEDKVLVYDEDEEMVGS